MRLALRSLLVPACLVLGQGAGLAQEPDFSGQGRCLEAFFEELDALRASPGRAASPLRILQFGDSHVSGPGECKALTTHLERALGPWSRGRLEITPLARTGASAFDLERWLEHPGLQGYMKGLRPSLVVLAFGSNEAAMIARGLSPEVYEARITHTLQRVRALFPGASVAWLAPPDQAKFAQAMPRLIRAQRRACAQERVFWLDRYVLMGGSGSFSRWQEEGLAAKDGLHFSQKGYRRLQAASADVLAWFYRKHTEGRSG